MPRSNSSGSGRGRSRYGVGAASHSEVAFALARGKAETEVGQDDRYRNGPHDWGCCMTRYRRGFAWVVVGLLVFTLVATLVLEGIA